MSEAGTPDTALAAKQRVENALEALREALGPYVAKHMRDRHGKHWRHHASRLRKIAKASQTRIEKLEAQYARLRASASVLHKALFGSRSEQQEKPRSEHKRGQQRGAPGHGRTQRPALEEKAEHHNPPRTARLCSCCGKPHVANGENSSTFIEDRSQGPHAQDRPSPLAPRLRLRIVAPGSIGAPGAAAVPENALRNQRVGMLPVRALRLPTTLAPGLRMDVGPGAADLGRDAGR